MLCLEKKFTGKMTKLNCRHCMQGDCQSCVNGSCLCRESHNKAELIEAFTQTASNLLPNSPQELIQLLRDNPRPIQQLTINEEPIEDIKPNRWITLEEQEQFARFLSDLGIDTEKLEWCASEWEKFRCSDNHSHGKKIHYVACGKRGICPRCSMSYASKRASIAYKWVKDNLADHLDFDLKMNQIVLTLPKPLHDMNLKLFSKMIRKFMKHFDIDSYGFSIQTRHSKDPLSGRYVHAHILSLNMKETDEGMIQNDYFFDVDLMRTVWKDIIEKSTDTKIEGYVNLNVQYSSVRNEPYQVLHMFSYLYRYPIQDLFNVQVRSQTLNYVQSLQFEKNGTLDNESIGLKEISDKVKELFDEKKPRLVWCGMLTSTKRKQLIKKMGVVSTVQDTIDGSPPTILQLDDMSKPGFIWKSYKDIEKEIDQRSKECRDCGLPYEETPFERGSYDGDNEPIVFSK